jgi:prophage tail gpP-like protein
MMTIRVNGENLTNFQRASATRSIETLSGFFNFVSTADNDNLFPVKGGDLVEILVNGFTVLTGYVDGIILIYDGDSHTIAIKGRDFTQDFVDSSVKTTKEFTGGTLYNITRTVLNDLGLTKIKIINQAGDIEPFPDNEIQSAEPGENAFEFIEKYARKRQVLLTTDGLSNIVFARSSTKPSTSKLVMRKGRSDNNILRASFSQDQSGQYYEYKIVAQDNLTFLLADFGVQSVNQDESAFDPNIRRTRYLEINAEDSMKSETAKDRATWEANFRRSNSKTYDPIVQGFMDKDVPWTPNTLVNINDDFAKFRGDKLLKAITYNYDIEKGSTSRLSFTVKDAYSLKAIQDQREAERSEDGESFLNMLM